MTQHNKKNNNNNRNADSTGVLVYKRDKQMNEIQQKIEENRRRMFEKRLALKKYVKTHGSNDHIKEVVKKYRNVIKAIGSE